MDHYDRLGNNVDLANADEGEEDERYVGLPEDDDYFDPECEAMEDELGAMYGDPRRCAHHPSEITSSPDGMFDAPCGYCEHEMERCEEDESDVITLRTPVTPVVVVEEDDDICF